MAKKIKEKKDEEIAQKNPEEESEAIEPITIADLKKAAELESQEGTEEAKVLEEKKKKILEKAKKLAEKIDVTKTEDLKEKIKLKKRIEMLVPLEEYVKAGIYLGTKVV